MKTTVYLEDFHDAFIKAGRESQFSYEARNILFNWIEEFDNDTGEETELDVIALCCEFTENSIEDIVDNYGYMMDETAEHDRESIHDFLNSHTLVCGAYEKEGITFFVYQQF